LASASACEATMSSGATGALTAARNGIGTANRCDGGFAQLAAPEPFKPLGAVAPRRPPLRASPA
jgi:hypothetical protein